MGGWTWSGSVAESLRTLSRGTHPKSTWHEEFRDVKCVDPLAGQILTAVFLGISWTFPSSLIPRLSPRLARERVYKVDKRAMLVEV